MFGQRNQTIKSYLASVKEQMLMVSTMFGTILAYPFCVRRLIFSFDLAEQGSSGNLRSAANLNLKHGCQWLLCHLWTTNWSYELDLLLDIFSLKALNLTRNLEEFNL